MGLADPEQVRRLAGRVTDGADLTRAEAGRVTAAAQVGWESTAALRFQARLEDGAERVRAAATELDHLAASLTAHAAAIEHRRQQINAAKNWLESHFDPRWLEQQAAEGASDLVARVRDVQHAASNLPGMDIGWMDLAGKLGWTR